MEFLSRSQTCAASTDMCEHDSVFKLFGPSEIIHNHYTCRKNNCFRLTKKGKLSNSSLKRDHFKHQWVNDRNLAFDSRSGMWWLIEGLEGVKWELGFAYFRVGKWDLLHWDWDLATGTGKKSSV